MADLVAPPAGRSSALFSAVRNRVSRPEWKPEEHSELAGTGVVGNEFRGEAEPLVERDRSPIGRGGGRFGALHATPPSRGRDHAEQVQRGEVPPISEVGQVGEGSPRTLRMITF